MTLNDEILSLAALNEYAGQDNCHWQQPDAMAKFLVCRHGILTKIPELSQAWEIYHKAKDYLRLYMEIAAFNDGLSVNNIIYQEIAVFRAIDGDCNKRQDICEIRMQVYLKP